MHWYDLLGYLGSVLMFSTFYMKTMIPLRLVGIAANVSMIVYTAAAGIYPVLILQACLLPLNVLRLVQMRRLIDRVAEASTKDFKLDALVPFMTHEHHVAGQVLFRKGEKSDKLYLIQRGGVRLQEIGHVVGQGDMLGEIGILSPNNRRTATAVCEGDTDVLTLTEDKVLQMYYQDPKFGFYLVRLIIQRLLHNLESRQPPGQRESLA